MYSVHALTALLDGVPVSAKYPKVPSPDFFGARHTKLRGPSSIKLTGCITGLQEVLDFGTTSLGRTHIMVAGLHMAFEASTTPERCHMDATRFSQMLAAKQLSRGNVLMKLPAAAAAFVVNNTPAHHFTARQRQATLDRLAAAVAAKPGGDGKCKRARNNSRNAAAAAAAGPAGGSTGGAGDRQQ